MQTPERRDGMIGSCRPACLAGQAFVPVLIFARKEFCSPTGMVETETSVLLCDSFELDEWAHRSDSHSFDHFQAAGKAGLIVFV